MQKKLISIVTPCYNEEGNVVELHRRMRLVMEGLPQYDYEHIFIDNASTDDTVVLLRGLASTDPRVKLILNARNFGQVRSPVHGFFQAAGDAVGMLYADLQDPPELFVEMLRKWEEGYAIVAAIKDSSDESRWVYKVRSLFYKVIGRLTDVKVMDHFTGFGLYDQAVVRILRDQFPDPMPYFRGMIAEIGLPSTKVYYNQKQRFRGITKNNFYSLYDIAMLGITNLSKVPLRLVTFMGLITAVLSLLAGAFYFLYKIVFWYSFSVGIAPLVLGLFFLGAVQLLALGIIGEYIGSIHTFVQRRPLVVERERVNF
jgi:glycosyltransferase involved in cell wall biosynthesis